MNNSIYINSNIQDETFPHGLIEFDDLENEIIPITPENLKNSHDLSVSQALLSSAANTSSSGNFSLSTENNSSSLKTFQEPTIHHLGVNQTHFIRKENENLDQQIVEHREKSQSCNDLWVNQSDQKIKITSSASSLTNLKSKRNYGHVKSKVKQFIDDLQKNDKEKQKKLLVKSKSMPFSNEKEPDKEFSDNFDVIEKPKHLCKYTKIVDEQIEEIAHLKSKLDEYRINQEIARDEISNLREINQKIIRDAERRRISLADICNRPTKVSIGIQTVSPNISPINETSFELSFPSVNVTYQNDSTKLLLTSNCESDVDEKILQNQCPEVKKQRKIRKRIARFFSRGCMKGEQ